ncbi:cupin domain-containing protein [Candidatus Woesebacteria bacterium]|nr:MAG: cupin domain-containing protein [Candidatus Woesebacteria bacterium]
MEAKKIISELKILYPGKKIYVDDLLHTGEVICELESRELNPQRSVYIAVIDKKITHYHRQSQEVIEVIKGNLIINVEGREHTITPGRSFTIMPGQIHFAQGNSTWIKVTSIPGMSPEKHVLVE